MAEDQENLNPAVEENLDEAALNEEASRELAEMVAEEESAAAMDAETPDDGPLSAPQSQAERAAVIESLILLHKRCVGTSVFISRSSTEKTNADSSSAVAS